MATTQIVSDAQFKVDLAELQAATSLIVNEAAQINMSVGIITNYLGVAESEWRTPAGAVFPPTAQDCITQMNTLTALLAEMIPRMKSAYTNYHDAETANQQNLNTKAGGPGQHPTPRGRLPTRTLTPPVKAKAT